MHLARFTEALDDDWKKQEAEFFLLQIMQHNHFLYLVQIFHNGLVLYCFRDRFETFIQLSA